MTFTSYAQNFEDVMLWRALRHVTPGFYIDVGAQDPVIDSVSFAFYENGWRGVHVEPTRRYAEKIGLARPEESVRRVAIGDTPGKLTFHEFPETGLSTAEADIAQRHVAAGYVMEKTEVEVITLASLLDEFRERPIHWLKIDVEGMEASVLRGWQGSEVRPWVLILESTKPSSQEENYAEWEHLVLGKDYAFVYFDGLNRFYVHKAHAELIPAFRSPPNVFDGFFLSGTSSHPFYNRVQQKERARVEVAEAKATHAETAAREHEAQVVHLNAHIQDIYSSASWRITRPLRGLKKVLRAPRAEFPVAVRRITNRLKKAVKSVGAKAIRKSLSYPKLRGLTAKIVSHFPAVDTRLRAVATRAKLAQQPSGSEPNFAEMSEAARRVFNELKRVIDRAGH